MALNIKPLSDRVLIEPVAARHCFRVLLDTAKENHKRNCRCCGNGTKEHTMTVSSVLRKICWY
jgi:chaperonin GroES